MFSKPNCPRLALHIRNDICYFYYSDILSFESRDHATYVILESGETLCCGETLSALEKELAMAPCFYR